MDSGRCAHVRLESQLLTTEHDISKNLVLVDQTDVILLDFFKAFIQSFTKVPHQHLLHKQYYRVTRKTQSQIESFMTGRIQQVAVQGTLSSSAAVLFGVPQGMVLCPLFYLVQNQLLSPWANTGNEQTDHHVLLHLCSKI